MTIPQHLTDSRLDAQWNRLISMTSDILLTSLRDKDLAAKYQRMLSELRQDLQPSTAFIVLGMRRAPASKNRHHDREGGLVEHLLEMWALWEQLRKMLPVVPETDNQPKLTDSLVWRAILHHDLNKVHKYVQLVNEDPWSIDYAKKLDRISELLGPVHKCLWILNSFDITLPIELHNALIVSEGGFSETHPGAETVLAKIVYLLDELSANVVDRMLHQRFWDSLAGGLDAN